jgi:hypothetical protein
LKTRLRFTEVKNECAGWPEIASGFEAAVVSLRGPVRA